VTEPREPGRAEPTEPTEPTEAAERAEPAEPDWERRRRLARVFGDVLPESTRDDRDPDDARAADRAEGVGDRWLRDQVPPHHGS
jgi:hypothetical protein